jgi:hypothetical protein
LYDNFHRFNRSEVLHFHKLDQQRKVHKENEVSRPTKYNKIRESTMSFDNAHKKIHNIDSDGCRQLENWEKIFGPPQPKNKNRAFDTRKEYNHPRGGYMSRGELGVEIKIDLCIACIMREIQIIEQETVQSSWNPRRK